MRCSICGFSFESVYGKLGRGFIECHHVVPLAQSAGSRKTSLEDLVLVCSNCHRMLHRDLSQGGKRTLATLRSIVERNRKRTE
ncbi:HNH endonuclease [bacterium]|nr:HNH endonuclease [bacterium]